MLPRVTEILKAAGLIAPYPPQVTPWHIERGTVIHAATVLDDEGDLDDDSLDEEVLRRVNLYREWKAKHCSAILEREKFRAHEALGYCGTPDMVAIVDGERTVVDIKQWPQPWHAVQLAAYEALTGEPARRLAVYLGGKKVRPVKYDEPIHWDAFRGALMMHPWTVRYRRGATTTAEPGDRGHAAIHNQDRSLPTHQQGVPATGEPRG